MDLAASEIRVLGSLVEKQLTTPQQYPLTLNALALACSQSSNRDPVVHYDEHAVEEAVTSVKTRGLARFVHPSHGRSALRYGHTLDEAWGLDSRPLALLAVLMLRGPQTLGELRTRTERMVRFSDLGEVQAELDALAARSEPLVARQARAPGQKEDRFAQLLALADPVAVPGAAHAVAATDAPAGNPAGTQATTVTPSPPPRPPSDGGPGPVAGDEVANLRAEVARLRDEIAGLRDEVGALRRGHDELRQELGA